MMSVVVVIRSPSVSMMIWSCTSCWFLLVVVMVCVIESGGRTVQSGYCSSSDCLTRIRYPAMAAGAMGSPSEIDQVRSISPRLSPGSAVRSCGGGGMERDPDAITGCE